MISKHNQRATIKVWILTFVCSTTSMTNLKVMDSYDTTQFLQAFSRFACEAGFPKMLLVDAGSQLISGCENMVLNMIDLKGVLNREYGIQFDVCPVGGHNYRGKVERKIKAVRESVNKAVNLQRLSVLQWETLSAEIANSINNHPIAIGNETEDLECLDLITPNRLRLGRNNDRSPIGSLDISNSVDRILNLNSDIFNAWWQAWLVSALPKVVPQPKWFKTEQDLQEGDLVYFMKSESKLSNEYTMGKVDQVITGKDGITRRIVIKYFNHNESEPKFSDRAVRSVIKIFSIDEFCLAEDLAILQKKIDKKFGKQENDDQNESDDATDTSPGTGESIAELSAVETVDSAVVNLSGKELWTSLSMQLQKNPRSLMLEDGILCQFPTACNLTTEARLFMSVNSNTKVQLGTNSVVEQGNMDKWTQLMMSVNMHLD